MAIVAGITAFYVWPALGFWLFLMLILASLYLRQRLKRRRFNWSAGLFLIAASWAALHCWQRLSLQVDDSLIGQTIVVEGRIEGLPEQRGNVQRFNLRVTATNPSVKRGALLRLSWFRSKQSVAAGELWRLPMRLKPPHGMVNFHGFDYERWLFQLGVHGTGYVRDKDTPVQRLAAAGGFSVVTRMRSALLNQLSSATPHNAAEGMGLLRALTLGDRSGLDDEAWSVLRRTGTSHLVAISGLHIGLVAGLVFLLASWLWARTGLLAERIAAPRAAAIVAVSAACFYAALAGFSLPTQRALIMLLVAMLAIWSRTSLRPAAGWWLALAAVLVWSPASLLSGGFWLSFMAVAWIIFWLAGREPRPRGWRLLVQLQLLLAIGLWPVTLYFFGAASLTAPLVNLVAVPLVSLLLVPLALVCVLLLPLSSVPAIWFAQLLQNSWRLLEYAAELPFSQWTLSPPLWVVIVVLISTALLLMPRGLPGRWAGFPGLALLLLWQPAGLREGELKVTTLDVGQGLSIIVETRKHQLLFDGGAAYASGFDIGERIVLPELQALNISRLDKIIASHGDNDHRGGLPAVLAKIPTVEVLAGGRNVPQWQLNQRPCAAGQQWQWDGVVFEVLWPATEVYTADWSENDLSCVLLIRTAQHSLLLTGDIEFRAEQALLSRHPQLSANILQVPHHGSRSSSHRAFLKQLAPSIALVSAGNNNRFRHPHPRVLGRYAEFESEVFRSDRDGAVSLIVSDGEIRAAAARKRRPGWWRSQ